MSLSLFFRLTFNKVDNIRMVNVQNDHLSRAPRLASRLDNSSEGIESLHKAQRTASRPASTQNLSRRAQRRKIRPRARSPLEEHPFGLRQSEDGIERILYRIDEAGRALRPRVSGGAEFNLLRGEVPVPVSSVRLRLDPFAAHVEPHRRIESHVLPNQQMDKLIVKSRRIFAGAKISVFHAPVANRLGDARHQLPHARL